MRMDPDAPISLLCTYLTLRSGGFAANVIPKSDVVQLKQYVDKQVTEADGEENLRDNWGLSLEDFSRLRQVVG